MLCGSQRYPRKHIPTLSQHIPTLSPAMISGLEAQKTSLIVSFNTQLSLKSAGESPIDGLLVSCLAWERKKGKKKWREKFEISSSLCSCTCEDRCVWDRISFVQSDYKANYITQQSGSLVITRQGGQTYTYNSECLLEKQHKLISFGINSKVCRQGHYTELINLSVEY